MIANKKIMTEQSDDDFNNKNNFNKIVFEYDILNRLWHTANNPFILIKI